LFQGRLPQSLREENRKSLIEIAGAIRAENSPVTMSFMILLAGTLAVGVLVASWAIGVGVRPWCRPWFY